jgi:CRISPR-associated protein Cas1
VDTALEDMKRSLRKLDGHATVEAIRGVEGAATATYWPALGLLLQEGAHNEFRRSRPAADPINAVINYMTAILERDIRAAIQSAGLHTGFAFLHSAKDRNEGLIYDLMEPFRAPLTEGLAVYLFNAHRLRNDMFATSAGRPVEISAEGRRAIIIGYEAAVAKRVNRTDGGGKLAWRAMMQHQARSLAHAVSAPDASVFLPYLMEA